MQVVEEYGVVVVRGVVTTVVIVTGTEVTGVVDVVLGVVLAHTSR